MARLRRKGQGATLLVRDDDLVPMPIMPWGTTHTLTPTEGVAARNTLAISAGCGVVSIVAIGGGAHFRVGDATVVATTDDPFLPGDSWHEVPLFQGSDQSYVSILAAPGSGDLRAQIVERQ